MRKPTKLPSLNVTMTSSRRLDCESRLCVLRRWRSLTLTFKRITCGLYINIILGDYVRAILNLNRSTSTWVLDPRGTFEEVFGEDGIPRGIGNQVSVEFNLIYRWHAAISRKDEQWANDFYNQLFPNQDPSTLSLEDFKNGLRKWSMSIEKDPGRRTFGGLTRKEDGAFEDSELVKIIQESTEDVAGTVINKAIALMILAQRNASTLTAAVRCFRSSQRTCRHEGNRDPWNGAGQEVASGDFE